MKKRSNKKRNRFKVEFNDSQIKRVAINMRPEELAVYIRRAEKEILPTLKEMDFNAATAIILLAQYTQALVTGDPRSTPESANIITNIVITLWETGVYQPGPKYPFTLEETLSDLRNGPKARNDHSESFQSFMPTRPTPPRGIGQVAGGIVQHPKTHLWQIWMMMDGPCEFLGAYHNASTAQEMLEEIVNVTTQGKGPGFAEALYQKVISRGDGEPQQIPFDMMSYLIDNLQFYMIEL